MNKKIEKKKITHQDKPIRPRYGQPDLEEIMQENVLNNDNNSLSHAIPICQQQKLLHDNNDNNDNDEVASSYTEIPFSSQYMHQNASCRLSTAQEVLKSNTDYMNAELLDNEEHEIDDDEPVDEDVDEISCNLDGNDHYFYTAQKTNSHVNDGGAYGHLREEQEQQQQQHHQQQQKLPQIDVDVINDIEIDAQYLAASVDNLLENLCSLLHSISSITADNVEVHRNAVNCMTDSMDANIKCMYTIMAKTEEITKSMKPTEQLAQRIREVKRLVDMLESTM